MTITEELRQTRRISAAYLLRDYRWARRMAKAFPKDNVFYIDRANSSLIRYIQNKKRAENTMPGADSVLLRQQA